MRDEKTGLTTLSAISAVLLMAMFSAHCWGYPVGPAVGLDEIAQESDLIIKGQPFPTRVIEDNWFKNYRGFDAYATEIQVISVINGHVAGPKIVFRHYGSAKGPILGRMFMPQHYEFQPGRAYIVFAKKTDTEGVFRQLWKSHKMKADQGVILAADDQPVAGGASLKEIIWAELNKLLMSPDPKDAVYAIRQLDEMSKVSRGGPGLELDDFNRDRVVDAVHRLIFSNNKEVAGRAIRLIGAGSPYIYQYNEVHWLATVGGGKIHGIGKRDGDADNVSGRKYWLNLASVADGDNPTETRALAIRALGRAKKPGVLDYVLRWADDPEPLVRQAAVILSSEFPGADASRILTERSKDEAADVRIGVAHSVGFGQFDSLLPLLDQLLQDEDANVRTAAALSLISFAPAKSGEILRAHADDPDFTSVFVNALAEANPEPYLDSLIEIIEKRLEPRDFWGGRIPSALSWDILFRYIQEQDAGVLKSGKLDKYLDVLENAEFYGSSEPRDLYALYVKREMTDRARGFRAKCRTTIRFDMQPYFDAVDEQYGPGAEAKRRARLERAMAEARDAALKAKAEADAAARQSAE